MDGVIADYAQDLMQSRSTTQLSSSAFIQLLRSSCLLVPSEYYIFQMSEKWLLAQEKKALDILRNGLSISYLY